MSSTLHINIDLKLIASRKNVKGKKERTHPFTALTQFLYLKPAIML